MRSLLFLAHRIPYPPEKGDKIRSWHILRHLSTRYRVYLGCFVDDARDRQHEAVLRQYCADCCLVGLNPLLARLRSTRGFMNGAPLTVPYYHDAELARWVEDVMLHQCPERIFVYSSAMAQYVRRSPGAPQRVIIDFVDVDSEKWRAYGERQPWPAHWVYAREARTLLRFEGEAAASADVSLFVSAEEAELFRRLTPGGSQRVDWISNGVDCDFFSPDRRYPNPFAGRGPVLVFTGAMDYWPNIDAVTAFAREVLPVVRARVPGAMFCIVGAKPTRAVRELACEGSIEVTGRVSDVRPYLAHASAVVAPLRIARGVQNKVLEAMAMGRPTVVTPEVLGGIAAEVRRHVLVGATPAELAEAAIRALSDPMIAEIGRAGRVAVREYHDWQACLGKLDFLFDGDHNSRRLAIVEGHTHGFRNLGKINNRPVGEKMACRERK